MNKYNTKTPVLDRQDEAQSDEQKTDISIQFRDSNKYMTPITENTLYMKQVGHIFKSVPYGMPTFKSCMYTAFGAVIVIIISAVFLSICDGFASRIVIFLLGIKC